MVQIDENNNLDSYAFYSTDAKLNYYYENSPDAYLAQVLKYNSSNVISLGGCPLCKIGMLEDIFTWSDIIWSFLVSPIGFWKCLNSKEKRCSICRAIYG